MIKSKKLLSLLLLVAFTASLVGRRRWRRNRLHDYDYDHDKAQTKPSSSGLPLISDLHRSPPDKPLLNWSAWAARHGPVAVANLLLGVFIPVVVLNTAGAAAHFLAPRRGGGHCNSRPRSVSMELLTGVEARGTSRFLLLRDYDGGLRLRHRVLTPSLGPLAAPRYQAVMDLEVRQLLADVVKMMKLSRTTTTTTTHAEEEENKADKASKEEPPPSPPDFVLHRDDIHTHLERAAASVLLAMHYGIRVPDAADPTLGRLLAQHREVQGLAARPWLVDLFPALRHLPLCVSPWRRAARAAFEEQKAFNVGLLRRARSSRSWNAGRQADAILAKSASSAAGVGTTDDYNDDDDDGETKTRGRRHSAVEPVSDIDLAYVLATSVEGGMETISRQLLWLLVALATHPTCQDEAHELLDAAVGRGRLPRFSDRARLAYVDALVAETLRWRPIAPISIPRRTGAADEYGGVSVGAGVNIVANSWAIGRDPLYAGPGLAGQHSDVEDFVPERWLQVSYEAEVDGRVPPSQARLRSDLSVPVFGQGRRGCLGQKVALDALFLHASALLWAFDISVAGGERIDLMAMEASGFMALPAACRLVLKPRGDWAVDTIMAEWDGHEKDVDVLLGAF
ncbi:cytochrome P450 family 1 protein [Microdochium nivale]|nr:cytochrome P450 family 1 protein [Microdochium nivale]